MEPTHFFELIIAMLVAIIVLHYAAHRLGLPPSVALLAGGALLAFIPNLPEIEINPELVLVIFLPPLLLDGAWSISISRLRRHLIGIASLAIGAVLFTCLVVALVSHWLFPSLPWAACAALGAIVSPPDAVSARAVLQRVRLPRRLQILLEGESLFNDASGLVLFRFAVAATITGLFSPTAAVTSFFVLALGGALLGSAIGVTWVLLVRRLGDEYLIIAATTLLSWTAYLLAEKLHVSGVIATVTTGLIVSWHAHTLLSASTRMRGSSFWTVIVFLMEASVFILIGLSLRGVVERSGGFDTVFTSMVWPAIIILFALTIARFVWVYGSDLVICLCNSLGFKRHDPLGMRNATVLAWAGVRGVVTLTLALSLPADFPGRDFILVTAFIVILGTVLVQGTSLGTLIEWAGLSEPATEKPRLSMPQAELAMANAQLAAVERLAHDESGTLIHPRLLDQYQRKAKVMINYAESDEPLTPGYYAHFDVVLQAIAAGRQELIRLHRAGDIDDETLRELERDLDLDELSAIAATSTP